MAAAFWGLGIWGPMEWAFQVQSALRVLSPRVMSVQVQAVYALLESLVPTQHHAPFLYVTTCQCRYADQMPDPHLAVLA